MPIRLFAAALLSFATMAFAAPAQDLGARFDPDDLTSAEARRVQAALALEGDYEGLLDGAWGPGSQAALDQWTRRETRAQAPTRRAVGRLMRRFERERTAAGWDFTWHERAQVGHLAPKGILSRQGPAGPDGYTATEDGGLVLRLYRDADAAPDDIHAEIAARARRTERPYLARRSDLLITAGRLGSGQDVYVRSDLTGREWFTHVLLANAENRSRLQLMAASFVRRPGDGIAPAESGTLAQLERDMRRRGERAEQRVRDGGSATRDPSIEDALREILRGIARDRAGQPPAPERRADAGGVVRDILGSAGDDAPAAGSGFRINTTDILTGSAVVAGCARLQMNDGTPLEPVLIDDAGFAVVAQADRAADWLPVAVGSADAGSRLTYVSFGTNGPISQRTSLRGAASEGRIRHDVRVRSPGGGAVLLDGRGRIVGLTLPTDGFREGTALPVEAIVTRLRRARVPFYAGPGPRIEDADAVPGRVARAAVSVRCADR